MADMHGLQVILGPSENVDKKQINYVKFLWQIMQ